MKKSSNHKKPIKEGSMSNFESVAQFKEQVERYILKHKDNPNAVINDLSSGLFFAFSEAFSKDGRPETNGLNMLEKMIGKLRVLMKTHENLIPEEEEEFEFGDENEIEETYEEENETQNVIDELDDNISMDEEENEELQNIYESKRGSSMKKYKEASIKGVRRYNKKYIDKDGDSFEIFHNSDGSGFIIVLLSINGVAVYSKRFAFNQKEEAYNYYKSLSSKIKSLEKIPEINLAIMKKSGEIISKRKNKNVTI